MLSRGNSKTGSGVWTFSLPAIETCPGSTGLCRSFCYAKRGRYVMPSVKANLQSRALARERPGFVEYVVGQIDVWEIETVRIHASGDFDTVEYVERWIEIVERAPDATFYAYTRSWRVPELVPALRRLSRLPNMTLWFSADRETGRPPRWRGWPIAYVSTSDADLPRYPVDVVFRDKPKTLLKRTPRGDFVCPVENGAPYRNVPEGQLCNVTCESCRVCFDSGRRERAVAISRARPVVELRPPTATKTAARPKSERRSEPRSAPRAGRRKASLQPG